MIILFLIFLLIITEFNIFRIFFSLLIFFLIYILYLSSRLLRKQVEELQDEKDILYYSAYYLFIALITANISLFIFFLLEYYYTNNNVFRIFINI